MRACCEILGDMGVRIGNERGKETICQCASGVYHSERRPGLDPRFEVNVKPVVFPLSTTNYAAKSAFSVGNLHTPRRASTAYSFFKPWPQLITDDDIEVGHSCALQGTLRGANRRFSVSNFKTILTSVTWTSMNQSGTAKINYLSLNTKKSLLMMFTFVVPKCIN